MKSPERRIVDELTEIAELSYNLKGDITNGYSYIERREEPMPINTLNDLVIRTQKPLAMLRIKKVIFNNPATIVFWSDGTKTVVKCGDNDTFDPEKGLAMAISKKFFDNMGYYYDVFKKWLPKND